MNQLIDIDADITGAGKNAAYKIDFTNNGNYFKGWKIELDVPFEITKLSNAEIVSREGTKYVIQDVPWNDDVQRGETTSFGFETKGEVVELDSVLFNGQKIDINPPAQEIELEFGVTKKWKGGFTGEIEFTNEGDYFRGWTIKFNADFDIDKIWGGEIVARQGNNYTIKALKSNDDVHENETTTFGFRAKGEVSNLNNLSFNGQTIDVDVETEIEEPITISPTKTPTLSNKAIKSGFEQHNDGTIYNRSTQNQDWDVLFTDDKQMQKYSRITDDEAYSGNKSLQITYPSDDKGAGGGAWKLPSEKEYYLSYWVKFSQDFDFDGSRHSGGKLPGLSGAGGYCSGGQTCNGSNGFSSRYMWGQNGRARLYLYHMDKPGKWGENFDFKDDDGKQLYFERGKWHNLIQRVKINDGHKSNGEIDVWMNVDFLSIEKNTI